MYVLHVLLRMHFMGVMRQTILSIIINIIITTICQCRVVTVYNAMPMSYHDNI